MAIRARLTLIDKILRSGDAKRASVSCDLTYRSWKTTTLSLAQLDCQKLYFLRFREGLSVIQDNEDNKQRDAERRERGTKSLVPTLRLSLQFLLYI